MSKTRLDTKGNLTILSEIDDKHMKMLVPIIGCVCVCAVLINYVKINFATLKIKK